jgi:predicted nucleic acid-binding protein
MLPNIKSGKKIFVDPNIFVYHFLGVNDSATDFIQRCEQREIIAYTSSIVIAEVLHRLMIAEVI